MSVNNGFVKVMGRKDNSGVRVAFGYTVNSIISTCSQFECHLGKRERNYNYGSNGFLVTFLLDIFCG